MLINKWRFHVLRRPEGDDGGASGAPSDGAAGDAPAAAAGAGGDGAAPAVGGGAPAVANALAAGAAAVPAAAGDGGAAPAPAAPPADPFAWLPEKHRVFGEDGKTLDLEASARKVAEAYGHAERRLGSGDIPPKDPAGYKVNLPEVLKDKVSPEDFAKDPGVQSLLGKLHAVGANQRQVDVALEELATRGAALREAMPELQAADCEAELRQADGWKSDAEYTRQVGLAWKAGSQIFGKDFDGIVKDYGNDPRVIRGLASIGREMEEDRGPSPEAQMQMQESLDTLMADPAYLDANAPMHATIKAKVEALTARVAGTKPITGKTVSFRT